LKEPLEEDLRLAVFFAGMVFRAPRLGEFGELVPDRQGGVSQAGEWRGNLHFHGGRPGAVSSIVTFASDTFMGLSSPR